MNNTDYLNRLKSCGISDAEALRTVKDFRKNFSEQDLEEFVREKERESHVDLLQSEPNGKKCRGLCGSCGCQGSKCQLGTCLCSHC